MKERNLAEARRHPGFSFYEADLLDTDALAFPPYSRHRHHPSGRQGWGAAFAGGPGGLCPRQCHGDRVRRRGGPRREGVADPVRLVLLGLRRQHAGAVPRGCGGDRAGVAVRGDQAGGGAVPPVGRADLRFPGRVAPVLHRLRSPAAPRPGNPLLHQEDAGGRDRSPSSATAPRRGTTPIATTSSSGCWRRSDWSADAPVGVDDVQPGREPLGAHRRDGGRDLAGAGHKAGIQWAPMQPGDVQQTAADLTKSGAVLGYAPRTPFPEGIRRFVAWFREAYGRPD